jgi:predicted nucleic acid-binding protein
MTLVVDASTVVAALVDTSPDGRWAEDLLRNATQLIAPAHMHIEAANALRRLEAGGHIDATTANIAFNDLQRLPVLPITFNVTGDRVWDLRKNLTSYDAAYIATAELVNASLATLDRKLANAPGTQCQVLTP